MLQCSSTTATTCELGRMKRLLAMAAAALMILGAFVLRSRLDDGGSGSQDVDNAGTTAGVGSARTLRLGCIEELAAVCEAVAAADRDVTVVIGPAGRRAASLTDGTAADVDSWLTFSPWVGVVNGQRQRSLLDPALGDPGPVLARSELAISIWSERADALATSCGGAVSWRCLGERAGGSWADLGGKGAWGSLRPTYASPSETATGLLTLGQIGTSWFGRSDFSSNDFQADGNFSGFFARLARTVPATGRPFEDQLVFGVSKYDAVGTIRAIAEPAVARSRYKDGQLRVVVPQPVATADIVLVPVLNAPGGRNVGKVRASVTSALADAGWTSSATLPATNGLPADGVLVALRTLFVEVTR